MSEPSPQSDEQVSSEELLPLLYNHLRRLAARKVANEGGQLTIQATELVHEAYLRLFVSDNQQKWDSESHFYFAAAEAMRRILVDRARQRNSLKRGGHLERESLPEVAINTENNVVDLIALDEALHRLEAKSARHAQVVNLRFFAGMTIRETATLMELSETTIESDWAFAKAWLRVQMDGKDTGLSGQIST